MKHDLSKLYSERYGIDVADIEEIIKEFGSIEAFRDEYIQMLIDNARIRTDVNFNYSNLKYEKKYDNISEKMAKFINKYKDKLIFGFDITQPNLVARPKMTSMLLSVETRHYEFKPNEETKEYMALFYGKKDIEDSEEEISVIDGKLGNFYNWEEINKLIDEELSGEKNEWFRYAYGIGREQKDIKEIAKMFNTTPSALRQFLRTHHVRFLVDCIREEENRKIDAIGREKFIRAYFEKRDIFITDERMENEDQEELIELYNQEVTRVQDERQKENERKIENLGFSTKVERALWRSGYKNIDDLLAIQEESQLSNIRGLGTKGIEETKARVRELGYKFEFEKKSEIVPLENGIEQLNLSPILYKRLKNNGHNTIDDLLAVKFKEELGDGIGEKYMKELQEALLNQGYQFQVIEVSKQKLERTIQQLFEAYAKLNEINAKCKKLEEELRQMGIENPLEYNLDSEEGR